MKRALKTPAVCLFLSFSFLLAASDETIIRAEVDKTVVTAGEPITYKLNVTTSARNVPSPTLPDFKGFKIVSAAQASTIAFGAGKLKSALSYTRILLPSEPGKYKISPSAIKIGKETISSNEIEIEVKPGKAAAPQANPPSADPSDVPETPADSNQTIL